MSYSVKLQNISKMYRLYDKPLHKVKEAFVRSFFRTRKAFHREFWALRDVNLDISRGETIGLIGSNGSGKSTLLQIIAGVLWPTDGAIEVNGRVSALLELGAGFNREFTGRENIFMNGAIMGISKREMEERYTDIISFADIGDFVDQPVKTYSSGMYVRLAFATAIHVDPDILVVDEALAVGDISFQNRCYRKIEELQKRGKTIILVSHDMMAVKKFCGMAILLDRGKIVETGAPNEVVNHYHKLIAEREEEYLSELNREYGNKIDKMINGQIKQKEGEGLRYGAGDARIVDYQLLNQEGIPVDVIGTDEMFTIRSRALFLRDVEEPVMGMLIKTLKGIDLVGASTVEIGKPIGPVKEGTIVTMEFIQKNRLTPGDYVMSVGVSEKTANGIRALDRRIDTKVFKVIGNSRSYGLVDFATEVRINKEICSSYQSHLRHGVH